MDIYTLTKSKIQTLPHLAPNNFEHRQTGCTPLSPISLDTLQTSVNKGIEHTTKGEFQQALDTFRLALQTVPLMSVSSQSDIKEV